MIWFWPIFLTMRYVVCSGLEIKGEIPWIISSLYSFLFYSFSSASTSVCVSIRRVRWDAGLSSAFGGFAPLDLHLVGLWSKRRLKRKSKRQRPTKRRSSLHIGL